MLFRSKILVIFSTILICYILSLIFQNNNTISQVSSVKWLTHTDNSFKVGIQAGHWKNSELPDELEVLREEATGTQVGKVSEWQITLEIAQKVAEKLKNTNIEAEVLPSTIPVNYQADAFVSLHADGNDDTTVSGYKIVASDFDKSEKAELLAKSISDVYGLKSKMDEDFNNITTGMSRYYAFNFTKFLHSVNPKTPAVILELGFLTNSSDRQKMVNNQDLLAQAIADGIVNFKESLGE